MFEAGALVLHCQHASSAFKLITCCILNKSFAASLIGVANVKHR